jgi:DsbC/DsbD-like thiol-disulfide interchange protein
MGRLGYLLMTWVAALLLAAPAHAKNNIAASLVPETRVVAPGQTVTLALVMKPNEGWHGYWKNPGDSGIETSIAWQLPAGVTAGPIQYPVPDTLIIAGLMNYIYKGDYAQLIDVAVPAGLAPGTRLPLRGRLDYLACTDEICVPESADIAVELETGTPGARDPAFDGYRQALPKPLGSDAAFQLAGNRFRMAVPIPSSLETSEAYFFPLTDGALAYAVPQAVSRSGDTLIVETDAGGQTGSLQSIEGVLKIGDRQGLAFRATPGAVPAAGVALAPAAEPAGHRRYGARGIAGCADRRTAAQHHALRVPDPQPQGDQPRQSGRRRARGPAGSARLHGRGGLDLPRARRGFARHPLGRRRCRLGVPAAGSARDPLPAAPRSP